MAQKKYDIEDILKRIIDGEDPLDVFSETIGSRETLKKQVDGLKELFTKHDIVLDKNSVHAFVVGIAFGEEGTKQKFATQVLTKIIVNELMKEYGTSN